LVTHSSLAQNRVTAHRRFAVPCGHRSHYRGPHFVQASQFAAAQRAPLHTGWSVWNKTWFPSPEQASGSIVRVLRVPRDRAEYVASGGDRHWIGAAARTLALERAGIKRLPTDDVAVW